MEGRSDGRRRIERAIWLKESGAEARQQDDEGHGAAQRSVWWDVREAPWATTGGVGVAYSRAQVGTGVGRYEGQP